MDLIDLLREMVLILIGYTHFKKSRAYKAEADISFESHPHLKRIYKNTEFNLKMQQELFTLFLKINKDNLSKDEISNIEKSQKIIQEYIDDKSDGLKQ